MDQSIWLYKFLPNTADRPTANDAIRVENLLKQVVKKQETLTSGHILLTHSQRKIIHLKNDGFNRCLGGFI